MPYILAKKGQDANTPTIRLVTIWFGESYLHSTDPTSEVLSEHHQLTAGTNDSVLPGREQHLPISEFTANMRQILDALTSPSSPYAVSDTPVSIVLITPGPPYHPQMADDARRSSRSVERTREFRDEVVRLHAEYKEKEAKQDPREGEWGWKIALVDFWGDIEAQAGGVGDGLVPFYLYVECPSCSPAAKLSLPMTFGSLK